MARSWARERSASAEQGAPQWGHDRYRGLGEGRPQRLCPSARPLLEAQGFDRVEPRRPAGGADAEGDADDDRHAESETDGVGRDDGLPLAETREQLGGYYVVEAKNLDEALKIAARIPSVKLGSIEVRPLVESYDEPHF